MIFRMPSLRLCSLALSLAVYSFAVQPTASAADEFEPLFNGHDLSGWEGDPALWTVEDGAITGATTDEEPLEYNKFLIWRGGTVDNFELRAKVRLVGNSNSGIQYRSRQLDDAGEFVVGGYQCDIHPTPANNGMLYDEKGRGIIALHGQQVIVDAEGQKWITGSTGEVAEYQLDEWNEYTIIAQGNRLVHKINGRTTMEVIDHHKAERELEGIIALQVHRGPAMRVQVKDVRLKRLPAGGLLELAEAPIPESAKKVEPPQRAAQRPAKKRAPASTALYPADATPSWIWLKEDGVPKEVFFRRYFTLPPGRFGAARLYASCDNSMVVFVNGQRVARSDRWETPTYVDVSRYIQQKGRNVIAVRGENAGGSAGLLVRLVLETDRDEQAVITDDTWLASSKNARDWQQPTFKAEGWQQASVVGKLGDGPWTRINEASLMAASVLREVTATPADQIKPPEGFKVELLYTVPQEEQGSWVSMCVDPKGRLIVCDQYGKLYRVVPPPPGQPLLPEAIEPIDVDLGEAQGLLWAFDSLYVMVNTGGKYASGLYRVRDTDDDDRLDSVELLRALEGHGEHGPHAILPHPDGKSLVVVCGNNTKLTEIDSTRVPRIWDEDLLLPRVYGRGFMRDTPAPGGYIARVSPDGKQWELLATGFRNEYDAAFNLHGELFAYDADMEWDMNTPWYRPTRICTVVSGAEFGWRNGSGKWPVYFPDSVPPAVDIGPGSPTGVTFGYGARFPLKYQQALYCCDWSWGILYAVHLKPDGAAYTAEVEKFLTGAPLPLSDIVTNEHDGAMYFLIGGRRTTSGMYRLTYIGDESTEPATVDDEPVGELRDERLALEAFHGRQASEAVDAAWPYLGHSDRALRYAARVALEFQDPAGWQQRALDETEPQASLTALLAVARVGAKSPDDSGSLQDAVLASLDRLPWDDLSQQQRLELVRVYGLAFMRLAAPDEAERNRYAAKFDAHFPAQGRLNGELCQMLVYLESPHVARKTIELMASAPTQEEQIEYAKSLRLLKSGWTPELREAYFSWFVKAKGYRGGASFDLFVDEIKQIASEQLTAAEKVALQPILDAQPEAGQIMPVAPPRPVVQQWKLEELLPLIESGLSGRNYERGRSMFGAANCFACHRYNNEGGAIGPDLTAVSGRFSPRDLLESIVLPSKTISDQYSAVTIVTGDGRVVTGRIVNLHGDNMNINTNMLDPTALEGVDRKQIEQLFPSPISMMPEGLLNTLREDEILDLLAYLISRGDPGHEVFQSQTAGK